ncbi:MAG: GNAT family N-acetyltransferase [Alphaproteobacteria bacterium]|nr:GNAT family N-acetyltransferase [Alphaproteobacteria bacterium]
MFLRSNVYQAGLEDGPARYQGLYVGAFDGDILTDIAAHYWNGHIILQAPTMPVELAVATARESQRVVTGIIGPWSQVKVAEPVLDLDRTRLGKVVPEYLYSLDLDALKIPESLSMATVHHRLAAPEDVPILVAWRREYDRITMGFPEHAIDDGRNDRMFRGAIKDHRLWVLEVAGHLVAMTSFNAVLSDTVQIGGVFTPEASRGRGHARSVVAGSLVDAKSAGVLNALLFTEVDNIPAQKAYESLGFNRVGDYGMVVLDPS